MKKIIMILLIFPISFIYAQKLGEMAPNRPPKIFPPNAVGADLIFSGGGFGLGGFFRRAFSTTVKGFVDMSFSEYKDEREVQYVDYFGRTFTFGKKNRVFLLPVNIGIQYRLFENSLTDNLRPYINFGVGPNFVITTPYKMEFFNSFGKAKLKVAMGGYVGFGAYFGLSEKNLLGINLRYYFIHLFNNGVESLYGRFKKDLGGFYITLNLGVMY